MYATNSSKGISIAITMPIMAVLINIALWIIIQLAAFAGYPQLSATLSLPSTLSELSMRPWGIFTYMFSQTNLFHLLANATIIFFFGRIIDHLSPLRWWLIYLSGGFLGAIAFIAISTEPSAQLIGASAAASALMAYAAISHKDIRFSFAGLCTLKVWWVASALAGMDLILALSTLSPSAISHLAGLAAGVGMAIYTLNHKKTNNQSQPDQCAKIFGKLRTSGHASLTQKEKEALFNLSTRRGTK